MYHGHVFWWEFRPVFLFMSWADSCNVSSILDQVDWQDVWAEDTL